MIHNAAKIYFDANSPIVTEQTTNTIMQCGNDALNVLVDGNEIEITDAVNDVQWYYNGSQMLNIGYTITVTQTGTYQAIATLQNGCTAASEAIFVEGVEELRSKTFSLYPNPAGNFTNLQLGDSNCDVIISNTIGQQVQRMNNVKGLQQIRCADLPHGTYIVKIIEGDRTSRLKLSVE